MPMERRNYTYTDGETREYKGVTITRHADHWMYPYLHWYIEVTRCLTQNWKSKSANTPFSPYQKERVYFEKLVEAKRYIDEFLEKEGKTVGTHNGNNLHWWNPENAEKKGDWHYPTVK